MSSKMKEATGVTKENFIEEVDKDKFIRELEGENIQEKRQNKVVIKKVGEDQFVDGKKEEKKEDKTAPTSGNGYFSKSAALKDVKKNSKLLNTVSNEETNEITNEVTNEVTKEISEKKEEVSKPKPVLKKKRRTNRVVLDIKE